MEGHDTHGDKIGTHDFYDFQSFYRGKIIIISEVLGQKWNTKHLYVYKHISVDTAIGILT